MVIFRNLQDVPFLEVTVEYKLLFVILSSYSHFLPLIRNIKYRNIEYKLLFVWEDNIFLFPFSPPG